LLEAAAWASSMALAKSERYEVLDALRGIAMVGR
jgi:uncharacterized membrane protein YeiB